MDRILIVPAAGRGARLGATTPKALVPVAGRPMLDHLLALHGPTVLRTIVVVAPSALDEFGRFIAARGAAVDLAVQPKPTGMLDAIVASRPFISAYRPARVAVTWCDQLALAERTVRRVAERALATDAAVLVLPTLIVDAPYIHFDRDSDRRIVGVRQRREGDLMPERGETDMGLFDLSLDAYLEELAAFARESAAGAGTGERNFLPFVPWLAARREVETVAGESLIETVGINTPDELARIEAHLARRGRVSR
ncbi:MAG: NTP transferase domain-containing protein [Acidobacteria bacterium]|nr:NTP transferase domain-containing protein [Acidobacteriota bacterium]